AWISQAFKCAVSSHAPPPQQGTTERQAAAAPLAASHQAIAPGRIGIHEGIGGSVIGLAWVAHGNSHGREEHEEIQVEVTRCPVQVGSASYLGCQNLREFRGGFIADAVIVVHSGTMDNALQRTVDAAATGARVCLLAAVP